MRINIIGNVAKTTGVSQDMHILHGMIVHVFGKETEIRHLPHFYPHCPEAEVNFFIEVINPSLFAYAAKNIWLPNPEWTYQTWIPYIQMVDEVWVKSRDAEKQFIEAAPHCITNIKYVGWTSIDKVMPSTKNFAKAIVPVGKNVWRNPKPILQAYMRVQQTNTALFSALPELHIVHSPTHVPIANIPTSISSKVVMHSEVMEEAAYDALLHECGLVICTSAAEGFGHAVNEALSAGCVPVLTPIEPFREHYSDAIWCSSFLCTKHPQCLGGLEEVDIGSIVDALLFFLKMDSNALNEASQSSRNRYEIRHRVFIEKMSQRITESLTGIPEYSLEALLPKEDELPMVSVLTLTRDRRAFFPLAKYCMIAQSYPLEKIEWVIVDDGKDQIKDLVSELPNVKYVLVDEPMTIGAKRNLAVESASHDILVMMDDDDVYPNNSILARVAHMLAEPKKECIFSTTIPCYEIHEKKSFMNVPPTVLAMSKRVSEATLCFTREFWKSTGFPHQQIAEGDAFIHGREHMCREFSPQDVIVSLIHKRNTSSRKPPAMAEPNGCHYGFSDDLFTLVSEIGERL